MPTYKPYTEVSSLPANSGGERTILEAHLDSAHGSIVDVLEYLTQSLFTVGGVVLPGSVTNPSDALVQVQGLLGVTEDCRTLLAIGDASVDLADVATTTRCLVVVRAEAGATTNHTFTDPATTEALTHSLLSHWGRLAVLEGDSSDYPPLPDDCVLVAEVTKTGAASLTVDTVNTTPPTLRYAGAGSGDVVGPSSATDGHLVVFDGATGKVVKDGGPVPSGGGSTVAINAQSGTTYTLVLADAGKLVTLTNGSAITLTVPTNASAAYPVGTVIVLAQLGTGLVTVEGDAGVTINGATPGDDDLAGQWATASLTKLATDTWLLSGGLA